MNSNRTVEILLVEDSPTDALLTQRAFAQSKVISRLHLVEDGVKAMAFLRRQPPYEDAPRPHLVLLDLNLPRMDGREVLAEIKADPGLQTMPVIILTTSDADEDVARCYRLQANCYITKPVAYDAFTEVVALIETFWFKVVTLPPQAGG